MKLYYEVTDNSYCISLNTLKPTRLVQEREYGYSPDPKEDGAKFKIISAVFKCDTDCFGGEIYTNEFVIVKSTKTGVCYRVLYNKHNVYQKVYKKEYLFR